MKQLYRLCVVALVLVLFTGTQALAQTPPPGISGQAFRDWIKVNFYDGQHTQLGYSTARMYMYNYIDNDNNTIVGVYSGFVQPWNYGGTGTNPAPINCEHTVPQSFFGSAEPMRSDIHHLFPTYGSWNSTRSNYPFADIDDNVTTKWMREDLSQSGTPSTNIDEYSEYASLEFEPREDHKGDCARAVFYFYTMYPTQGGNLTSVGDLNLLYQWHLQDPVSTKELNRNDDTEIYQGNRNPFIDNPSWVTDAWETSTGGSVPAAPSSLSLTSATNALNLSWSDVASEDGYYVYRSLDNTSYNLLATLSANATSYTDAGLSTGTTYYYYLLAYNTNGNSPASSIVSGQPQGGGGGGGDATDLFISEYIEGSSFNKALEIANFTGATVDLSAYVLKKETNGGGSWGSDYALGGTLANSDVWVIAHSSADANILAQADINTGSAIVTFNGNDVIGLFKNGSLIDILGTFGSGANYAQDQTLVRKADIGSPNATYTTSEWDFLASNTFTDIGVHTYTGSGPNPPATPANLALLATTVDLNLSWDDVADEDGYTLYRSADNVSFSSVATLGVDQTSYTDASVLLETPYYYYVAAFNAGGTSGNSNTASGQTEPTPPATPANLSLLATTIDLNLSWDDVANEDGYTLYRSADNVSFNSVATLGVDQTSYTDASVQLETPYYYYVAAFNAGGTSGNSNTVSGQTEPVGPAASELLISEYIEGSSFNKAIEIANNTGASVSLSGYVLKKQTNGAGAWGSDYALSGSLAQGEVWVIANSAASAGILAEADVNTGTAIMSFNGNDAMGLFKNGTLIDMLGVFNDASNYAQNVTLIRKAAVDVPNNTFTLSEWDVFGTDVIADLGTHSFSGGGVNPPTAPANLSLVETIASLDLSWDDLSNEDGYLVYRSTDNTNFSQIGSLTADVTAYVDVSLALETLYYYYIVAYNVDGNSPNSATVSGQTLPVASGTADLFISEYIEGSKKNRAIEIANFSGNSVNLGDYSLMRQANGSGNWKNNYALSGTLIDGDVFVLGRSDASSGITSVADQLTTASILNISGNDPIGLFKNGVLIDIVGAYNGGNVNFGRNTTLVRKSSVSDPIATYDAAEWDAYSRNTFTYLGSHVYGTGSRAFPPMLSLKAFPNPFSDYVQINLDLPQSETVSITILNLLGQPVANVQSQQTMVEGEHGIKFNASHLAAGLYILKIQAGAESQTMRIVKQ